jgi:hypothetical protein
MTSVRWSAAANPPPPHTECPSAPSRFPSPTTVSNPQRDIWPARADSRAAWRLPGNGFAQVVEEAQTALAGVAGDRVDDCGDAFAGSEGCCRAAQCGLHPAGRDVSVRWSRSSLTILPSARTPSCHMHAPQSDQASNSETGAVMRRNRRNGRGLPVPRMQAIGLAPARADDKGAAIAWLGQVATGSVWGTTNHGKEAGSQPAGPVVKIA